MKLKLSNILILLLLITIGFSGTHIAADVLDDPASAIFEHYGKDIGLSNLSISSIVQDKNGFLWFGTQGGLNMFDSNEVTTFTHDPFNKEGLLHNLIQTMYYDEVEHVLWIGTYQGVSVFDINTETFTNYTVEKNSLSNEVIVSIDKDQDGTIWIGTLDGLNKFDPNTNTFENFDVPGDVVRDIIYTSTHELYIATYEGLCKYNKEDNIVEKVEIDLPSPYVMVMGEYSAGTLTVGMWAGGVAEIDLQSLDIIDTDFDDENVYSMLQSSTGHTYVGTWGNSLFLKSNDQNMHHFETSDDEKSIGHPIIYSLFEDSTGLIWIGTNGGGLFLLNSQKSDKVILSNEPDNPASLSLGKINSINTNDELFYFSVYNQGVNVYDPDTNELTHFLNVEGDTSSLANNNVSEFVELNEEYLLFGTNSGIEKYSKISKSFTRSGIVSNNFIVYALFIKGNDLWIGTYNNGVFLYDISNEELKEIALTSNSPRISDSLIYDIYVDSKNRIWIATNNGLNLLELERDFYTNKVYYNEGYDRNQLGSSVIKCIYEDSLSNIWVGTSGGGISKYNEDDSFTTYTNLDGLANNIVNGMIEDSNNLLWISTQSGISKFNPNTEEFINFDIEDGLGGLDFSSNVHYFDSSIYIGGIHGITKIDEDYNPIIYANTKIYITDIKVLNESISSSLQVYNGESVMLSHNENSISFYFGSLNFYSSNNDYLMYKLEGYDEHFHEADLVDYAHYSNLSPGTYNLIVKSGFDDDETSMATFEVVIQNPWYLSTFAYISYFLSATMLIYMAFKFYESRLLKAKNSELKELNIQLEQLSIIDPITQIYNRRYFDQRFPDLFAIAARSQTELSLILLDLDDFKNVNDNYGHVTGDEVLRVISERISSVLKRKTDFISRIGGDEFAIVLHDTSQERALSLSEQIREKVENPMTSEDIEITFSAGLVTIIPDKYMEFTDAFELADKELYNAKNSGKGKTSSFIEV